MDQPVLQMDGIEKRFGPLLALNGVDLELRAQEVHALLGENGAGKTTLMNIATGILSPDAGEMTVRGQTAQLGSPMAAFRLGLGMVHQNFRLVRNLTVAENIHLGWGDSWGVVRRGSREERTAALASHFGLAVNPKARIWELSVGEAQRVAILRALARGANILILDEPTAVLTPQEADHLFQTVRGMVANGKTVVFISHKLDEVMEIADRVSVLRGGKRIVTLPKSDCSPGELARLMVGHEILPVRRQLKETTGEVLVVASGISEGDHRGIEGINDINLEIREGEVVGVAGVSGNGQTVLAEVMTGMRSPSSGKISVEGKDLTGAGTGDFADAGIGYIPEDTWIGLAMDEPIELSAAIKAIDHPPITRGFWLDRSQMKEHAEQVLLSAGLTKISRTRSARTLSGGQAQRLLVHREMRLGRRALVAVHPTRGLDVAATRAVHELLMEARERGVAVLLISEDLDEILELSDRIVVMYEGRLTAEFTRASFDRAEIGLHMGGSAASGGARASTS